MTKQTSPEKKHLPLKDKLLLTAGLVGALATGNSRHTNYDTTSKAAPASAEAAVQDDADRRIGEAELALNGPARTANGVPLQLGTEFRIREDMQKEIGLTVIRNPIDLGDYVGYAIVDQKTGVVHIGKVDKNDGATLIMQERNDLVQPDTIAVQPMNLGNNQFGYNVVALTEDQSFVGMAEPYIEN